MPVTNLLLEILVENAQNILKAGIRDIFSWPVPPKTLEGVKDGEERRIENGRILGTVFFTDEKGRSYCDTCVFLPYDKRLIERRRTTGDNYGEMLKDVRPLSHKKVIGATASALSAKEVYADPRRKWL